MEKVERGISLILDFINAITPAQWYVFGAVLATSGLLSGIIAWRKRRHFKKYADKLEDWIITINLWFFSLVVTLGGFLVAVVGFGVDPGTFLPYLGAHGPQIIVLATGLYTFSKKYKQVLEKRRKSKRHVSDALIDGFNDIKAPDDLALTPETQPPSQPPEEVPTPNLFR